MTRKWFGAGLAAALGLALAAVPVTRADEKAERQKAEQEAQKAEQARAQALEKAEAAKARAERAKERAERAHERAERAGDRIRVIRDVVRLGGGYLGVTIEEVAAADVARLKLPAETGARVTRVEPDSPAARAGLREDDVIVRFGGEAVRSTGSLTRLVRETPAGRQVELEVVRGGAVQKLQATIDELDFAADIEREVARSMARVPRWIPEAFDMPEPPEPPDAPEAPRAPKAPLPPMMRWHHGEGPMTFFFDRGPRKLGIGYQEVEGQLAQFLKVPGGKGVLVTEVEADSPAAKGGLKAGDVIVKFAGRAIEDGDDFRDAVGDAEPGSEATLGVSREGRSLEVKVTLAGERERRRMRGGPTT
jgi:serine protease Do